MSAVFSGLLLKAVAGVVASAAIAINSVAWLQARAMTHYREGSDKEKTDRPESLTVVGKAKVILTGVQVPRPENTRSPQTIGLTYETHVITLSDQSWLEAWFIPAASETIQGTVLVFPPHGGAKESLLEQGKAFYTLGYNVLMVDYQGVGGSSGSDTTLGVREGKDVASAVSYASQTWPKQSPEQKTVFYGASLGAAAVMREIAHENVTPDAVILESPFNRLLSTVRHRFKAMGIPAFPSAELLVWWGGQIQSIDGFAHNPEDYASAIVCPVLLMHGEQDARVTTAEASDIYSALPGEKKLLVFPGIGHGGLISENPEAWQAAVSAFL